MFNLKKLNIRSWASLEKEQGSILTKLQVLPGEDWLFQAKGTGERKMQRPHLLVIELIIVSDYLLLFP